MKFVAAAVQMQASDDKAANLAEAESWVHQATRQGARLVVLPEVFIWRGNKKLERESAETIPGATSNRLSGLARQLSIFLLAGSILEEIPASSKAYNTSLLFDPSGNLLATYRKIHLFDVDLANGVSLRESETRSHGEALVAAQTELGTMGLSVCYDLRFPELYRGLADQGAQLIFVPFMTDGAGAQLIGAWFGTGPDRGIALVFLLTGMIGLSVTVVALRSRPYRQLTEHYAGQPQLALAPC